MQSKKRLETLQDAQEDISEAKLQVKARNSLHYQQKSSTLVQDILASIQHESICEQDGCFFIISLFGEKLTNHASLSLILCIMKPILYHLMTIVCLYICIYVHVRT